VSRGPATYGAGGPLALRPALLALLSLSAAGVLAGAAALGNTALGLALLATQVVVTLAWLAVTEVDGAEAATVVVVAGAAVADVLAVRRDGEDLAATVSVVALVFVASLAMQLARPHRQRVVEALAGTVSATVLAVFAAHLLATSAKTGWAVAATAVLCAAVSLVAGRGGDLLLLAPRLVPAARRGWPGLLCAVAAGAAAGAALGGAWAPLSASSGTAVGACAALAAAAADLAVDLMEPDATVDGRRTAALRPLAVLLPLVVAAPVAYAAARLLVG
jgi:hypothetical protein